MRNKCQLALLGLATALAAAGADADSTNTYRLATNLNPPILLLEVDHPNAAPFVGDFDEDGALDLLVGEFQRWPGAGAEVYAYRNIGSNMKPRFEQGQRLMAGGLPITVPEGCYTGFGPQLVDLDGDGHQDLISGAPGAKIHIFKGLGGGRFGRASFLAFPEDMAQRHHFDYNIRPHFCDWDGDGDGDFDLLVGAQWKLWLLRNTGDAKNFRFEKAEELKIGGEFTTRPIVVPYLADWDRDRRPDVILGSNDGSAWWCRNVALQGEPVLGPPQLLVPPGKSNARMSGKEPSAQGILARFCVADLNGDGRVDLVMGDASYTSGTRADLSAAEQASAAKARQIFDVLAAEFRHLQTAPAGETEAACLAREAALSSKRKECANAYAEWERKAATSVSRHGAVWLFTSRSHN